MRRASSSPSRTRAESANRSRSSATKALAVVGVADGAGRDRVDRLGPGSSADPDVVGDRRAGVLDRLGGQLAGEVDAPAQPGNRARRSTAATRPPATSATSSRVELVPMSITATLAGLPCMVAAL